MGSTFEGKIVEHSTVPTPHNFYKGFFGFSEMQQVLDTTTPQAQSQDLDPTTAPSQRDDIRNENLAFLANQEAVQAANADIAAQSSDVMAALDMDPKGGSATFSNSAGADAIAGQAVEDVVRTYGGNPINNEFEMNDLKLEAWNRRTFDVESVSTGPADGPEVDPAAAADPDLEGADPLAEFLGTEIPDATVDPTVLEDRLEEPLAVDDGLEPEPDVVAAGIDDASGLEVGTNQAAELDPVETLAADIDQAEELTQPKDDAVAAAAEEAFEDTVAEAADTTVNWDNFVIGGTDPVDLHAAAEDGMVEIEGAEPEGAPVPDDSAALDTEETLQAEPELAVESEIDQELHLTGRNGDTVLQYEQA